MTGRTTYRLAPRDRTGWVLGLSGPQVVILGVAVMVAVMVSSRAGLAVAAVPVVLAVAVAFGRVGGRPLLEAAPPAMAWALRRLRHRTAWVAPAADATAADEAPGTALVLPPPLDGQRLLAVDAAGYDPALDGAPVAVVFDPRAGAYTAALAVASPSFTLTEATEKDRLLAAWGDALAGFCTEGGPVASVRWLEWAAPAGLDDQLAYLSQHGHGDTADPAYASYRLLLGRAGPLSTRHHCLLTVTVDAARVSARRRHHGDAQAAAVEALLAELRLFAASRRAWSSAAPSAPRSWPPPWPPGSTPTPRRRRGHVAPWPSGPGWAEPTWPLPGGRLRRRPLGPTGALAPPCTAPSGWRSGPGWRWPPTGCSPWCWPPARCAPWPWWPSP